MPITFSCACGKTLRVPDASAGRRAKCPVCRAVVDIPAPDPEPVFEVVEDAPPPPAAKPAAKPVVDDDDATPYGLASGTGEDADNAARPEKNKLPNFRKGRDRYK